MKNTADIIIEIAGGKAAALVAATGKCALAATSASGGAKDAIAAILRDLPKMKRGAKALVLASDFFTQDFRLPASQTRGLSRQELGSALSFEAEPFSNIVAAKSRLAYAARESGSPDFTAWNVLQISADEIEGIAAALKPAGVQLAMLAPATDDLASADEQLAATMLAEKARAISAGDESIPVIEHTRSQIESISQAARLITVVMCALASVFCIAHYGALRLMARRAQGRIDAIAPLASSVAALDSRVKSAEAKAQKLEDAQKSREEMAAQLSMRHTAWLELLKMLPRACADEVVIKSISIDGPYAARIDAFTSTEEGPFNFMSRLDKLVAPHGWAVMPDQETIVSSLSGTGPSGFAFGVRHSLIDESEVK